MKKRITALVLVVFSLLALNSCTGLFAPKGEEATVISDPEAATVKNIYDMVDEKLSVADSVKSTATADEFNKILINPDISAASYYGSDDIKIEHSEYIDKTISVKTSGTATLSSPVNTVIVQNAKKGFTADAKADNILINGEDITADINTESGCIYIEGKNAVVNIRDSANEKILVKNVTATINNFTEEDIFATLVNGTKVKIPSAHSYVLKDNLIYKLR